MNREELLKEILYTPLPIPTQSSDVIVKCEKGWHQIINPSIPEADRNEIIICEQNLLDVQTFFEEKRNEYIKRNLPFKWCWNPLSKPPELETVLAANCSKSWEFSGMACDPTQISISLSPEVTVTEVDESNLVDYLDCMIEGWQIGGRERIESACLAHLKSEDRTRYYFVSYFQGRPVGAADFTKYQKSCYLGGAVVLPEFRDKGLYKALLKGRLGKIRQLKINLATTQARETTSAPILTRLGFDRVFTGRVYQFDVAE